MAHQFGLLKLPAETGGTLTDPAIDVLADYFSAVITHYLSEAWRHRAAGEPIIRKVVKHEPAEGDFLAVDLPALYLWRERDEPERTADNRQEVNSTLSLLWLYPPSTQYKFVERLPFFNGFSKVIRRAVYTEHDPAWIHPDDVNNVSAQVWGSQILVKAGLDWWRPGAMRREDIEVQVGGEKSSYPGLMAEVFIRETESTDPDQFLGVVGGKQGTAPTALEMDIYEDELHAQHEIEPDP